MPTALIEKEAPFLKEVRDLVFSLSDMPDAIGVVAFKNGLEKIGKTYENVVVDKPW